MSRPRPIEREDESSAPILREDQDCINEFARLNTLRQQMLRKREELQKERDLVEDASNEIILQTDDDGVRLKIGDCFFPVSSDDAEPHLAEEQSNLEASLKSLEADLVKNKERMEQLKVQLYAKFGRSINLDADD